MTQHLGQSSLLDLLSRRLSEERATEAFGHLASCTDCTLRLEALRCIQREPDEAWDGFVETLGAHLRHEAPVSAVSGAAESVVGRRFDAAVRVLLDGTNRLAAIGQRALSTFLGGAEDLQVAAVARLTGVAGSDSAEDREFRRLRESARAFLDLEDRRRAHEVLHEIDQRAPGAVEYDAVKITKPGLPAIQVSVDASRRGIDVMVRADDDRSVAISTARAPGTVLLVDPSGAVVQKERLMFVEGADYLLAEFRDLPDSDWVIAVDLST